MAKGDSGIKVYSPVKTTDKTLTGQQEAAITALCEGKTQAAAAEVAGVDASTVSRWKANDALFLATLTQRRQELWDAHAARLAALRGKALDVLEDALGDDAPDDARRWAVGMVARMAAGQERPTGPATLAQAERSQLFETLR